ncbi:MAG: OmpA family protein [bacterium]|nr:OmpA family protein [bacterium]
MKHIFKIGIMAFAGAVLAAAIAAGCAGAPPRTEASPSGVRAADLANQDKTNADLQQQQTENVAQGKQDLRDSEARTAAAAAVAASKASQNLKDSEARTAGLAAVAADKASQNLSDSEMQTTVLSALAADQASQDLRNSEMRLAAALAELAKLTAVREEERGMVITLSGSILFRSGKSTLLPSAKAKLDQVADALLGINARSLVVEGHTDSQEVSKSDYQGLSQRRADAVRDYLIQRSYQAGLIKARGMGMDNPIADNASAEGRANNRRVNIIVERESYKPKP